MRDKEKPNIHLSFSVSIHIPLAMCVCVCMCLYVRTVWIHTCVYKHHRLNNKHDAKKALMGKGKTNLRDVWVGKIVLRKKTSKKKNNIGESRAKSEPIRKYVDKIG